MTKPGRSATLGSAAWWALPAILAGAMLLPAPPVAAAVDVQPHRALYKITLAKSKSSSGIIDVQGRMGFEWRDACDGWAVEQRYAMEFSRAEGEPSVIQSTYSTWESKTGDVYRFFVKRNRGAGGEERVEGKAVMPLPLGSGPGSVSFSTPEKTTFELPADTVFPTEHTIRMIEAATTGSRFLRLPVFDGSEPEPPSLISAVLGVAKTGNPPIEAEAVQGPYYPSRLAWFGPDSEGSAPDFEMSIEILGNGIARSIIVDYDNFSVAMTLDNLEVLPPPAC